MLRFDKINVAKKIFLMQRKIWDVDVDNTVI